MENVALRKKLGEGPHIPERHLCKYRAMDRYCGQNKRKKRVKTYPQHDGKKVVQTRKRQGNRLCGLSTLRHTISVLLSSSSTKSMPTLTFCGQVYFH